MPSPRPIGIWFTRTAAHGRWNSRCARSRRNSSQGKPPRLKKRAEVHKWAPQPCVHGYLSPKTVRAEVRILVRWFVRLKIFDVGGTPAVQDVAKLGESCHEKCILGKKDACVSGVGDR